MLGASGGGADTGFSDTVGGGGDGAVSGTDATQFQPVAVLFLALVLPSAEVTVLEPTLADQSAAVLFLALVLPSAEVTVLEPTLAEFQSAAVLFLAPMLPSEGVTVLEPALAEFQLAEVLALPRLELIPACSRLDALRAAKTPFRMPDPLVATAVAHAAARSAAAPRPGHAPIPSRPLRQIVVVKTG